MKTRLTERQQWALHKTSHMNLIEIYWWQESSRMLAAAEMWEEGGERQTILINALRQQHDGYLENIISIAEEMIA